MIVLFGDSVHTLFPEVSEDTCKAFGFLLVLPTVFMPLNLLSVPSVFSSLATVLLVLIILFDGFWKTQAPGSILDPMPTSLGPELNHMNWLGGIGLILAGFGGHGVMPSIARDMKHPEAVDRIFNMAFTVAAAISMLAGGAGYLMMGDKVSDEITRDMMKPKYGYPKVLNYIAIWMIIVTPLTKFGLCTRPLHIAIEGFLNLAPAAGVVAPPPPPQRQRAMSISQAISSSISQTLSHVATSDYAITDESGFDMPKTPVEPTIMEVDPVKESSKGVLRMVSRTILTAACVIAAIVLPGFEKVMAFLGSFSAFLICIILPVSLSCICQYTNSRRSFSTSASVPRSPWSTTAQRRSSPRNSSTPSTSSRSSSPSSSCLSAPCGPSSPPRDASMGTCKHVSISRITPLIHHHDHIFSFFVSVYALCLVPFSVSSVLTSIVFSLLLPSSPPHFYCYVYAAGFVTRVVRKLKLLVAALPKHPPATREFVANAVDNVKFPGRGMISSTSLLLYSTGALVVLVFLLVLVLAFLGSNSISTA